MESDLKWVTTEVAAIKDRSVTTISKTNEITNELLGLKNKITEAIAQKNKLALDLEVIKKDTETKLLRNFQAIKASDDSKNEEIRRAVEKLNIKK